MKERLLSLRIIHYSKEELIRECRTSMECECGVLGSKDLRWGKPRFQKRMDNNKATAEDNSLKSDTRHYGEDWLGVVAEYTSCI
jgi:hypothetical protein